MLYLYCMYNAVPGARAGPNYLVVVVVPSTVCTYIL